MDLAGGLIVLIVFLFCYAANTKGQLKTAQTTIDGLQTTRERLAELETERAQLRAQVARMGTQRDPLGEHVAALQTGAEALAGGLEETSAFADWLGAAPLAAHQIADQLATAEGARDALAAERDQLNDDVAALWAHVDGLEFTRAGDRRRARGGGARA